MPKIRLLKEQVAIVEGIQDLLKDSGKLRLVKTVSAQECQASDMSERLEVLVRQLHTPVVLHGLYELLKRTA